jgi:hypothetical protein
MKREIGCQGEWVVRCWQTDKKLQREARRKEKRKRKREAQQGGVYIAENAIARPGTTTPVKKKTARS